MSQLVIFLIFVNLIIRDYIIKINFNCRIYPKEIIKQRIQICINKYLFKCHFNVKN